MTLTNSIGGDDDPYFAGDSLSLSVPLSDDTTDFDFSDREVRFVVTEYQGGPTVLSDDSDGGVSVKENSNTDTVRIVIDAGVTDDLTGEFFFYVRVFEGDTIADTVLVGDMIVSPR